MPTQYTYPGVYVEEVPSGVRTITGVATSITAFVGRARMGPLNEPVRIQSFGDFERVFGGLWAESPMTYAVQQFFANGGGDALVVRLSQADAKAALICLPTDPVGTADKTIVPANNSCSVTLSATDSAIKDSRITVVQKSVDVDTPISIRPAWPVPTFDYVLVGPPVRTEARGELKHDVTGEILYNTLPVGKSGNDVVIIRWNGVSCDRIQQASNNNGKVLFKSRQLVTFQAAVEVAPKVDILNVVKDNREVQLKATDDRLKGAMITVPAMSAQTASRISLCYEASPLSTEYLFVGPRARAQVIEGGFSGKFKIEIPYDQTRLPASMNKLVVLVFDSNGVIIDRLSGQEVQSNQGLVSFGYQNLRGFQVAVAYCAPYGILQAKAPGSWGNDLRAIVDHATREPKDGTLFNLTIQRVDPITGSHTAESFLNLSTEKDSPRYAGSILQEESQYLSVFSLPGRPIANSENVSWYGSDKGGKDEETLNDNDYVGSKKEKTGLYALEKADLFNLLCIPPPRQESNINPSVWSAAVKYCSDRRAILLVDPPWEWNTVKKAETGIMNANPIRPDKNAAVYWPFLQVSDPLRSNLSVPSAPSGAVAGVIARTDRERGIWKAPAGLDATLAGVQGLTVKMTDAENGLLNPLGLSCLRSLPLVGPVVWGARTSVGADRLASEWKYLPVRRMALYIEESLYRGMQWVVFEPNDERLWSQIRLNAGAFMQGLFREGAFQGSIPQKAYFVKCDAETNPQDQINKGIVTVKVGFAPLKPAEFVVIQLQQMAGQIPG